MLKWNSTWLKLRKEAGTWAARLRNIITTQSLLPFSNGVAHKRKQQPTWHSLLLHTILQTGSNALARRNGLPCITVVGMHGLNKDDWITQGLRHLPLRCLVILYALPIPYRNKI